MRLQGEGGKREKLGGRLGTCRRLHALSLRLLFPSAHDRVGYFGSGPKNVRLETCLSSPGAIGCRVHGSARRLRKGEVSGGMTNPQYPMTKDR
jgi:hypothetical protein